MSLAAKPKGGSGLGETAEPMVMRVQSPDLSRLLSISSIVVALVVAGALALEGVIGRSNFAAVPKPEEIAETPPVSHDPMVRADQKRVQYLEQRLSLLERQIVVLQTQVSSEQKRSSALKVQVTSLETAMSETETPAAEPVEVAHVSDAVPQPEVPKAARPEIEVPEVNLSEDEEAGEDAEDVVMIEPAADNTPASEPAATEPEDTTTTQTDVETLATGSIDPKLPVKHVTAPDRELASLVKPEVRNTSSPRISRTRFGIALDLYNSIDEVKAAWKKIKRSHGPVVGQYEPRALLQGTQEGELVYRLMVGPIENVADAARRCVRLERHGIRCKAAVYSGEPLDTPPSPGTLIKVEVVADDAAEPPLQPLPDPNFAALPAKIRNIVANAPLPRPKPKPSS